MTFSSFDPQDGENRTVRAVLTGALQESDGTTYNVATQMNSFVYNTVVGWCVAASTLVRTRHARLAEVPWHAGSSALQLSCHICAECTAGSETETLQCSLAARSSQRSNPKPGIVPLCKAGRWIKP